MTPAPAVRWREGLLRSGKRELWQRTAVPPGEAWARLGILHGYGDHSGRYREFMAWCAERGVLCQAFDFRGQGRSPGARGYVAGWGDYVADLAAYLAQPVPPEAALAPLFLLGHSHGGLVLAVALERGAVPAGLQGVILSAPHLHTGFPVPRYKVRLAGLLDGCLPWLPIASGLRDEWMTRDPEMLEDSRRDPLLVRAATPRWYRGMRAAQEEAMAHASRFRLPLLMLVPCADRVADPARMHDFFHAVGSPDRELLVFEGYQHELLRELGRERVYEAILGWMGRRAGRASTGTAGESGQEAPTTAPARE